ncbi:hypothetical protein, partial [Microbacterium sp.]|uniref:hypothetical protein n=1 Tax=Microbacterium sp. TaxID=51671 RepID=UPI003736F8DE
TTFNPLIAAIFNADAITADVWEGETTSSAPTAGVDAEEFEKAAAALKEAHATIEQLRARVAELEAAADGDVNGDDADVKGPYDDLDVDALKAEIDKRNEDRDKESRIDKRGGQDKLVAALVADDEAQES